MDAAKLMEYLRAEFGIRNRDEFEAAVSQMHGIDLGIFTVPFEGESKDEKQTEKEKFEKAGYEGRNHGVLSGSDSRIHRTLLSNHC